MKKVIGLVCVFLLLLSFTGCGESEEVPTGSDTTDRVQTEEKESLEIVKNAFKNFERPHSFAMEQETQVFEDGVNIGDDENLQLNKNEKVKTMIYVDGSQVTSKIWYSTKYGVALKTEAYNEKDDLFFMNQVVKIREGGEYSEKMVPPADMKWN